MLNANNVPGGHGGGASSWHAAGVAKEYDIVDDPPGSLLGRSIVDEVVPDMRRSPPGDLHDRGGRRGPAGYAEDMGHVHDKYAGREAGGARFRRAVVGAHEWYMPEGTTRPGFDEWVLMMNPDATPVKVTVSFYNRAGGERLRVRTSCPPERYSVHASDDVLVDDGLHRVVRAGGRGYPAERAMYIEHRWMESRGRTTPSGPMSPRLSGACPSGTTRPGFDESVLVQTPTVYNQAVWVLVTLRDFIGEAGKGVLKWPPSSCQRCTSTGFVTN